MNADELIALLRNTQIDGKVFLEQYTKERLNEQRRLLHEKLNECCRFDNEQMKNDFIIEVMSVTYPK